ncbi:hypothetical protein TRV_01391 [Trichophyton verrucosum HKI 0517]|uniref:Uncharacterized protein n=1 Tax=Trichophyton verrucosum (strain HKI 0517) TaxID=663202 RepID=D4D2T5_TRIVH|nr:uncharacterized protein TRV_01391 [Trichophyton verrucosum HKI 0517]EFE43817.1 hypothetical protein TRV_01391 [Trichophyton verrucosum HKI 0517]
MVVMVVVRLVRDKQRTSYTSRRKRGQEEEEGKRREGVEEDGRRRIFLSQVASPQLSLMLSLLWFFSPPPGAGWPVVYPASADCCHGNALPRPSPTSAAVPLNHRLQVPGRLGQGSSFTLIGHGALLRRLSSWWWWWWWSWLALLSWLLLYEYHQGDLDGRGAQQAIGGRCRQTVLSISQSAMAFLFLTRLTRLSLSSSSSLSSLVRACGVQVLPVFLGSKESALPCQARTKPQRGCDQLRLSNEQHLLTTYCLYLLAVSDRQPDRQLQLVADARWLLLQSLAAS